MYFHVDIKYFAEVFYDILHSLTDLLLKNRLESDDAVYLIAIFYDFT